MAAPARKHSLRPASTRVMWQIAERWRSSPHYRMLQTGETFWRRRLNGSTEDDFSVLPEWRAEGMTDYVAIITRFAAEGVIGEMDGVYSAWATRDPEGFTDDQIAALKRIVPHLGLAIKSVSLARMIRTLMEISWPRCWAACSKRTNCTRHCRANRCRRLVQRFARLHADQQYST